MSAPAAEGIDPASSPPRAPNILLLFADDQRTDTIAAHGNPRIVTPALDALARRGFSFRRNYCMGSIHGAVCQPSRAMLMSGRSLYHVPMDLKGLRTLPEVLRDRGYATFATGKWHNGGDSLARCFERGRHLFLGGMSNHIEVPVRSLDHGKLSEARTGDGFSSRLFADAAIAFMEQHVAQAVDKPFFAYVAFTAPHDPRQPPFEYRSPYYEKKLPLPVNFLPQHPFDNGRLVVRDEDLAPWPRTEQVIRDQLAEYYGLVTHLDEQVGRVLDTLRRLDLEQNTLVVYAADHGLAMGSHGLLGKQSVYEHSMGCPLIIAGPGIEMGESEALTYLFDLLPTLCEFAGTETPDGVDGKSLVPLLRKQATQVREQLFLVYEDRARALRDLRWKLIRYPLIDKIQLFDLATDPHELVDLSTRPEHAERVASMVEDLQQWQRRMDDPHPYAVAVPQAPEIDLTGRHRKPDRWQPRWIVEKYFGEN